MQISQHVQRAYEDQYQAGQTEWRMISAQKKAANIRELTENLRFTRVLEVGAGDGSILHWLSLQNFAPELYAVEISENAIASIQNRNLPQLRQVVPFDGYHIPFADNSFDLVILSHVLEHVEHERLLLRELRRLAPLCVLEVPKDYRFGVDKKVKHFLSYGHINVYTPSSLRFLLQTEGFKVLKQKVDVYSRQTYTFMTGGKEGRKSLLHTIKGNGLYAVKKLLVSLPLPFVRDHFANTITVLLDRDKDYVKIF
jgi:ubiquinone/menaquinone biosynthesis C-methylase UbiE